MLLLWYSKVDREESRRLNHMSHAHSFLQFYSNSIPSPFPYGSHSLDTLIAHPYFKHHGKWIPDHNQPLYTNGCISVLLLPPG